jgi:hypothetical protein
VQEEHIPEPPWFMDPVCEYALCVASVWLNLEL